jgi:hypothetical protein
MIGQDMYEAVEDFTYGTWNETEAGIRMIGTAI